MALVKSNRRFGKLAAAMVGGIGLFALAAPLSPADAQFYFGLGPGGFDVGVGPPARYYAPYYYGYGYPYYRPFYRPYYYPW